MNLSKLKFCIKRTFYIILGLFITYCILWTCNDHLKPYFDYKNDEFTEIIENTEYSDKMKEEAESGILKAQYNLAMAYLEGNGVEKNDSLAFMWFNRYASKSPHDGYYLLGNCYAKGIGVDVDLFKAKEYWIKSAVQDYPKAIEVLYRKFNITIKKQKNNYFHILKDNHITIIANLYDKKTITLSNIISFENIFIKNRFNLFNNLNQYLNVELQMNEYKLINNYQLKNTLIETFSLSDDCCTKKNIYVVIESSKINKHFKIISIKLLLKEKHDIDTFKDKALCNGFMYKKDSGTEMTRFSNFILDKITVQNDTIICTSSICK